MYQKIYCTQTTGIDFQGILETEEFDRHAQNLKQQSSFLNDTFTEDKYDIRLNIAEFKGKKSRLLNASATTTSDSPITKTFTNALYQIAAIVKKFGPTHEVKSLERQFLKRVNQSYETTLEAFTKGFSSLREELERTRAKTYHSLFSASLQLTLDNTGAEISELDKLKEVTVYPLSKIKVSALEALLPYCLNEDN